ncbi:aminoglycoside phosphotransferase family protein [Nocardia amamiensis]|uniref:aminoglycoside phosphotransferase family protein n=1 Tax=Nocardia amamiensis TaxID=404578 RepID=UPI00082A6297|nr:aminoglycoside phosphotransferase family protein [Nocardia amamiensis]
MTDASGLPSVDALKAVCAAFGIVTDGAELLHHRSNAVYLLAGEGNGGVIVRMAPDTDLRRARANTGVAVTRWLNEQDGEPIGLCPLPGEQPVIAAGVVATFWPYCPTRTLASSTDIAGVLRRLHHLPRPPLPVPEYRPLHRLREALTLDASRTRPALDADDHLWIATRADELVDAYNAAEFPLGRGLIHADAHSENAVHTDRGFVLIDWDQCCIGPRELDLVSGLPDHFHEPEIDRRRFFDAYGYDLLAWPHWHLLRDIAELHSVGAYIRLAPDKPTAAEQLRVRISSLRRGDREVRWTAVS